MGLATLLGVSAFWIIAAESLVRPTSYFPTDSASAKSYTADASSLELAAFIGWPRGDIWVEHAVSVYVTPEAQPRQPAANVATRQHDAAIMAAAVAPYDARPWALLAAQDGNALSSQRHLRMSYYTMPADASLLPLRLRTAIRDQPLDDDLRTLLEFEIGILMKQEHAGAIFRGIFDSTSGGDRKFFEELLNKIDPKYLSALKKPGP